MKEFLAIDSYKIQKETSNILDLMNQFFTTIFAIEMLVKIKALGFKDYARDFLNLFDGTLVLISIADVVVQNTTDI